MENQGSMLVASMRAAARETERFAAALDDSQWDMFIDSEQRTVGQVIDHIAWAWDSESEAFRSIASGATGSGWTQEWLDAQNADQAQISAGRTRSEIQERIRQSGRRAVDFVESLSAAELARTGTHMPGEPVRPVAGWIEACLIDHPQEHAAAIEALLRMPPHVASEWDESDDSGPIRPSRPGPSGECRDLRSVAE